MVTSRMSHVIRLLLLFCTVSQCQRTFLEDHIVLFRIARTFFRDVAGKTTVPGSYLFELARRNNQLQTPVSPYAPFPCDLKNVRSPVPPTSVHKLRPGDIDIIAAMGDSLSAGVGATASNLLHLMVENRGISWSGGGQGTWREFMTLPNILKVFNPNLYGYALSDSLTIERDSQFNVAESVAMSRDMPYMAEILVKRIKNNPRVDIQKHWKLITIMIGGNDFCSEMCYHSSPRSVLEEHRSDLLTVFRTLRDNLPRTLISLVNGPHLQVLVNTRINSPMCDLMHRSECSCLFGLRYAPFKEEFFQIMSDWQDLEDEFLHMSEFQREDFAIVVQPYTRNVSIPVLQSGLTDRTYLSVDCFHLTQKAYARAANAVWNNMMEPVGAKTPYWEDLFNRFLCPTEKRPYIATLGNS